MRVFKRIKLHLGPPEPTAMPGPLGERVELTMRQSYGARFLVLQEDFLPRTLRLL